MSTQLPLFYKNIVPLNNKDHKDLYILPVDNYQFTRQTNSIYIASVEFPKASREYPVVFGGNRENGLFPVVLLGLETDKNANIDENGQWRGKYIPAYVRRYPFILASSDGTNENLTVCVDNTYEGFNKNSKGQRLFNDDGEHADSLKQSVDFLREYFKHIQVTNAFCQKLLQLGITEPMSLNIKLNAGKEFSLGGFSAVSREKLNKLSADQINDLFKTGQLELIYTHLNSLDNVQSLMQWIDN